MTNIHGKSLSLWEQEYPLLKDMMNLQEVGWANPQYEVTPYTGSLTLTHIQDAADRLQRFASFLAIAFPDTDHGIVESKLQPILNMQRQLEQEYNICLSGKLLLKMDSHLPIAGSIKARGGVYEVLKHAESLAIKYGLVDVTDDYSIFKSDQFRSFFSQFSIAVGSTGNLGLSIGIIGAALGFKVTVHMSSDAKGWKKELLRNHGVIIKEYTEDYSKAVEAGRKEAMGNKKTYFIDDENSVDLFLGYAVAALRLQEQLNEQNISVDKDHPLFVYLPCGVGGAPGGITFGLKAVFGEHVHCFFVEPTHSPCMLLGMMTGYHDQLHVHDFGIDNQTAADGLAVGKPSKFVGKMMEPLLKGIYTVDDQQLFRLLRLLADTEDIFLEPSALAGMFGIIQFSCQQDSYVSSRQVRNASHIVWATGGSMIPSEEMSNYLLFC